MIAAGKVRVNQVVMHDFNCTVDPASDALEINGVRLSFQHKKYIAFYKPRGIVTTRSDDKGRQSVIDLLPAELKHLNPVGRLDMYSEGLLILTNDGEAANLLTHPSHHIAKKYVVKVSGIISDSALNQMAAGVELEDGRTRQAKITNVKIIPPNSRFEITIREGRNRQIRRMCEHVGYRVLRLCRVSVGAIKLGGLKPGQWRYLNDAEVKNIYHP